MKKSWLLLAALTTLVSTGAIASTPSPTGVETQTLIDLGRRDGPTTFSVNKQANLISTGRNDGARSTLPVSPGRRDPVCCFTYP